MSGDQFSDLTVILPTLNEVGNLESLIEGLGREMPGCRVIVVDDNSSDGTQALVRRIAAGNSLVSLIERHVTPCLTDSIQAGIAAATTAYVAWMDADHSHPPAVMRKLCEVARESGCCIGTRYQDANESFTMRLPKGEMLAAGLSAVLNFSVNRILRLEITDYTSGFIVCRRDVLVNHVLTGDYGEYFIELVYYLNRHGVDLREVYYESPPRLSGESKTGANLPRLMRRGAKYLWLVGRLMLKPSASNSTR
ncbi:MAG TPA: glycosyltransferase [Polyangiaceae bacterium]|nr:glycosyltransferase [Polyangiaceae bacterium]